MTPFIVTGNKGKRFFWNIDANVGLNSPNKREDVQLIQFGYFALAQRTNISAAEKAAYSAVVPGAPYSGAAADPLTIAIRTHQAVIGGTQDGHVSVIQSGTVGTYDGQHGFMLIRLVNNIMDLTANDFPRIDKHPRCPPLVRAAVLRASSS